MAGPLTGLRVLDISRLAPGPFCTMLLADLGADVVKVEEPAQGDYLRTLFPPINEQSPMFIALNRNKRSMVLDFKNPDDLRKFEALAAKSDIIVEGFRPGVADRIGVGYKKMAAINPAIIYCSISGYGQNGPYRDRSCHDLNILALAGLLGLGQPNKQQDLSISAIPMADLVSGMLGALGILAAVHHRTKTGEGQLVDLAMLDSIVALMGLNLSEFSALGRVREEITGGMPRYRAYKTKDERYMVLGSLEEKFWQGFCKAVGRPDLAAETGEAFTDEQLTEELIALFTQKTQAEWVETLRGYDVCCDPVQDLAEVIADPQLKARSMVIHRVHPTEGAIVEAGIPFHFSKTPCALERPSPRKGEHTEEVLAEWLA
ncbi:CaiB/BaiF CoA transferase family protein [Heliophilum fasciatum]|uniref:Crotonobetainyl-CoA:carnitine CoA-transferase CaiB-like acyl-CoA transferase n=1 Tax=Heliophilum fasciatum TaxID=35700 RepID=A0A4V2SW03_9FIRM|nr:CaiB/BaiF CoA-transferase family protein [Heliophilum fasciatum]MCW2279266.1 crotonobetainyl-CoA:carnitine CoA-transferase CaiB-like acyl-CoA transferase [Heliophilum fasciatum]TCP60486.1 crotonobetainyl-CoA:carnitine CoA-transferase CaiB-like acyl-CoA transferase [Heliophilum fasciatum]